MKIIFVPHSFPGPFRYTAANLAADKNNKVLFITSRTRRNVQIPGINRLLVNYPQVPPSSDRAEFEALSALKHGAQVAKVLKRLKNSGFQPDIIITHAAEGYAFYVSEVFPQAACVVYADGLRQNAQKPSDKMRNFFHFDALQNSKLAYTSTNWQKSTYPQELASHIEVLHEGIDTNFFSYTTKKPFAIDGCDLSQISELVTFSGRSADFNQPFPQFLHSLASVLKQRPQCHALIVGLDNKETENLWRATLRDKYDLDDRRIHSVAYLPYLDYRKLLHASTVHVFLSAPMSLSSGLFEAMSCGCLVLGSDFGPICEIIKDGVNGFLYNLNDIETFSQTITTLLENHRHLDKVRRAARQTMLENYNSQTQTAKIIKFITGAI